MGGAPERSRDERGNSGDDGSGDADEPHIRRLGDVLVASALVLTAAVVASAAANVIAVFAGDSSLRVVEELHLAADGAVTLLHSGMLVGASLILVAARFHDADSPAYRRALWIVAAVAVVAVVVAVFAALDVPAWDPSSNELGTRSWPDDTGFRIAEALDGLSAAAIASCAVVVCWLLGTNRIDFGPRPSRPVGG